MSLVIAEDVTQIFGAEEVLRGISLSVAEADAIALVGANGEGKTTLLRIIAGLLAPTGGSVHRRRGLKIGYLPQDPPALGAGTVHEAMLAEVAEVRRLEGRMGELAHEMAAGGGNGLLEQYGEVEGRFEALGGYGYHARIERILAGLGFERRMWDTPLSQLSGGQLTRAYLARLLLAEPDLLLLDEPTNHLDMDAVEWLESWLQTFDGATVVVSHDRYLLDRVTRTTWEIADGVLETYRAPYTAYLKQRDERHRERLRVWRAQQEYIEKTRDFIRRHIAGQRAREAKGRRKRLERFLRDEAVERPGEGRSIKLSLDSGQRAGQTAVAAEDLKAGYEPGAPLLVVERLEAARGDRIAIIGPNGVGKTTLARTLLGQLPPLAGAVSLGANVTTGYLAQTHDQLDGDKSAVEAVMEAQKGCTEEAARSLLGSLLLSGDDALKKISALSGGQRSRVVLARLAVQSANLLVLDEPTNHLDVPSTEIIEQVLKRFDGTVLFVSHDRYLIEAIATHIWVLGGGTVKCILGGWEGFLRWRERGAAEAAAATGGGEGREDYRRARERASRRRRLERRYEKIEAEIHAVEEELAGLSETISAAGEAGDVDRVAKLGARYEDNKERLEALWGQWEQLGEELQ